MKQLTELGQQKNPGAMTRILFFMLIREVAPNESHTRYACISRVIATGLFWLQ
jgi:hypothetical protein